MANEDLAQDLFGTTLNEFITADHQNHGDDEEEIDFSIEMKKYFGGYLDELIVWEDKLLNCDDSQNDWSAPAGEILNSLNDEQVELIESNSESNNEACDKAESYV